MQASEKVISIKLIKQEEEEKETNDYLNSDLNTPSNQVTPLFTKEDQGSSSNYQTAHRRAETEVDPYGSMENDEEIKGLYFIGSKTSKNNLEFGIKSNSH